MVLHVFFFKQKTAYEMRISDWSSDVCSSDLITVTDAGGTIDTLGNDVILSGDVTDDGGASGGLTKAGEGVLTLTGENSYSGGTIVSQGTLKGDTVSLQGDIENNATLEFSSADDGTFTGDVSGSGTLVKSRSEEHTSELQSLMR